MHRPTFQRAVRRSIAFAAWSLIFFSGAFGQNPKCAAEDYECYVRGYTAAISANPKNDEYYNSRAASYVKLKKLDEALQDYSTSINLNPKSNLGYVGRGYVYRLQNRYLEAVIELDKAIRIDPKDGYALDLRRYCLDLIGKSSSAIDDFSKLLELEPENAEYFRLRAGRYFQAKNFAAAVEDATQAITLDPKYADAYASRSSSYCELGKPKESKADIARYESLTGKKSRLVCDFCDEKPIDCEIRSLTERIAEAMQDEKKAADRLIELYDKRGVLYYKKGDYDLALVDFNKTENAQGNIRSSELRGDIHLRKGRYDDALFDFKYYLKSHQSAVNIIVQVGKINLLKSEFDEAFKYFDTAIFLNFGNPEARLGRAAVYLKRAEEYGATGRDEIASVEAYKNAIEDFSEVIKYDKKINPAVYLKRAAAYEKIGETEKAEIDRAKYQELSAKP